MGIHVYRKFYRENKNIWLASQKKKVCTAIKRSLATKGVYSISHKYKKWPHALSPQPTLIRRLLRGPPVKIDRALSLRQ